jgi:alkanesulfonate monooxygenase SsuD/methylene tetrahydromethanopterin reductase-like flavin-dependent oxidoreductase (luciferase family)
VTADHTTSAPQLGLVLPPATPPAHVWPAVEAAENGGFGSIWVTDRTISDMPWLETMTFLGGLAARTSRVMIGTSVLAIARRNPVLTAHAYCTAQYLSGGRVVAGIGLGGARPTEYELAGVPLSRRGRITDEYIGVMRRLWDEGSIDHAGDEYSCAGLQLCPQPETRIPIWIGGVTPAAYRRAGRLGDGWLAAFVPPEGYAGVWAQVCEHAVAAGRDPSAITPAVYAMAAIGRREGEAEALLDPFVRSVFGAPLDQLGFACLYGTPERWVDMIGRFGEAGAQHVLTLLVTADLRGDVDLILDQVLPQLAGRATGLVGAESAV